jgi:endonuclease III
VKITSARFDIEVDEERAVRLIHPLYKAYRSGPIVKGRDAVQWKHIPQGMRGGSLLWQQWAFFATLTDRRELSDAVYESHVRMWAEHPELYMPIVMGIPPKEIEEILRQYKVGCPGDSSRYWPRCAQTLFQEFGGDPRRMFSLGNTTPIEDILIFKSKFPGDDPLPGFGAKISSLYALYLAERKIIKMPKDAFPVDVHVMRFVISTGIVRGTGVIENQKLGSIVRPLLCRVVQRLGISAIDASHAIWFLGNQGCTRCYKVKAMPKICPVYNDCGGAIQTLPSREDGVWQLDDLRYRRGGDMARVLPVFESTPLFVTPYC